MHRIVTDMLARFGASSKLNAEWEFVTMLFGEGRRAADAPISTCCCASFEMGLLGILVGLLLLVWLAFRGWSVLVLAPAAPWSPPPLAASRCSPTGRKPSWAAPRLSGAILSAVSARRGVRQADGG